MDRSRLAIIIPAYNEGATIKNIVCAVVQYGIPIVIDDGCTDQTAQIAIEAGAEVVSHDSNLGYDAALNSGFLCAHNKGCDFALTMDADGQHNPNLLPVFIVALDDGADVIVGVRDKMQRFSEHVFGIISGLFWGIRDPLCGMKAYRMELYSSLGHFDAYGSVGTEMAIYAAREQKAIVQIPILTRDRMDTPRFGQILDSNWRILRALFHAL
ncbi:glycosyltransferase family 2 protein [Candidatus Njordibacter sp. Uisw_039]|uniref:glycosyltransferase family 2 protein n=1 Tax=Candidatus Njordibacter sp. Uisw_039 TaxID=3230972 RepID=UPI003D3E6D5B